MGVLGWSPDQFWKSTHTELMAALDGWLEKNGSKPDRQPAGMSRERLHQLMEQYPDGS